MAGRQADNAICNPAMVSKAAEAGHSEKSSDTTAATSDSKAMIYCKVCGSFVPKKKKYNPSICEACKKFFTRTCKRQEDKLTCQTGNNDCTIDGRNRRFCTSCRFAKCLTVGMRCRLWASGDDKNGSDDDDDIQKSGDGDDSLPDGSDNSQEEAASKNCGGGASSAVRRSRLSDSAAAADAPPLPIQHIQPPDPSNNNAAFIPVHNDNNNNRAGEGLELSLPLVQDPILFDGTMAENTFKLAAQAITQLHGLEFMPLKIYKGPINDMFTFWQLALRQLFEATSIGFTYGRHLAEAENVPENDINILITSFLPAMSIVHNMLPANQGAAFIGVNDAYMPSFFSYFPGFSGSYQSVKELGAVVGDWNPTFPEYALFVAFTLFNLGEVNNQQISRIRRRLLMIFNLYMSHLAGGSRTLDSQLYFKRTYRQLQKCVVRLRQGVGVMAAQLSDLVATNTLFSEVLLTQPEQTRLGMFFPKPPQN